MQRDLSLYDNVTDIERHFGFPLGTLSNIPIYARVSAIDAILKVRKMEEANLFRPGLYYIVLVDVINHTSFNTKYGDSKGDLRLQVFHTCVIKSIGDIDLSNYVAFSKTIGDAALLVFSSFRDVYMWSEALMRNLRDYREFLDNEGEFGEQLLRDLKPRVRRLVHLGEVHFQEGKEPLSLAVSQTFKIEKTFSDKSLGCTQAVADAIVAKIKDMGLRLVPHIPVQLPGSTHQTMTYYIQRHGGRSSSAPSA